ncbi:NADP-dependent aldehyde dehydrogenase [Microbacterium foliorum]|uniref:aldehyde dehydrogenase (NADP(+)) n=1 Tax=Microbacterium foliorum TaxID=104336 RepID=UPI00209EBE96|nr:aldehyde dehydrogenase (NADP(+)) [Microbacterium foliorum]MCP1428564.1 NADP-dependent aldehyde dehydrogenase [Microbacterium foliorum]
MTLHDTSDDRVDQIIDRAGRASEQWKRATIADRARALDAVADALDQHADQLIPLAQRETHLAEARLRGELRRTSFQLRMFAEMLPEGLWLDARIDHADAEWPMGAPRPDLRRQLEPIGTTLVFAASNFPFAFSVAGGDTASALAAGNAVVLKAHPGHPELSDATTGVVVAALAAAGAPEGLFQTIHGTEAGVRALRAPGIKAAAFTGSVRGGRALFDIAASRPEPIPFYGELGSTNPAFVTKRAAERDAAGIARDFVASVTGSAGQLCTKPGVLFVPAGSAIVAELEAQQLPAATPLLNGGIESGFRDAVASTRAVDGVRTLAAAPDDASDAQAPSAVLFAASSETLRADMDTLMSEMFGPAALVVTYDDESELLEFADLLEGQLTATIIGEDDDEIAVDLLPKLSERAGRVLWNQWPTGVSVTWAQQHGGPYPATTAVGTTSVGMAAITRFLRPVAYQNVPEGLLPDALKEGNPLGIVRRVDGILILP